MLPLTLRLTCRDSNGPPISFPLTMGVFDRVLRTGEGKKLRALQSLVPDIAALEPEIKALSDEALRHKTVEFRERIDQGRARGEDYQEILNDLLIEAFAVVREGATRALGQRHYDVQMMGGAALHFGWIAEMKTGEGKTLVSTLPIYLNGSPAAASTSSRSTSTWPSTTPS